MFLDDLNNSPQSPFETEQQPKPTNELRLFKGLANLNEFAAYFSGGLLVALACRLIPKMLVFYLLLKVATVGYLWLSHSDAQAHIKKSLRLIGLALALSAIAGYWDGIVLVLLMFNSWQWIAISAVVLALIWVVIEALRYKEGR